MPRTSPPTNQGPEKGVGSPWPREAPRHTKTSLSGRAEARFPHPRTPEIAPGQKRHVCVASCVAYRFLLTKWGGEKP
eukprot:3007988-Alexandrium_andersonii.AAC.1